VEAHEAPACTQAGAQPVPKLKKGFLDAPAPTAKARSKKGAEPMVSLKGAKKNTGMGGSSAKVIPGTPLQAPLLTVHCPRYQRRCTPKATQRRFDNVQQRLRLPRRVAGFHLRHPNNAIAWKPAPQNL
jgi:hypothetical protein